MPPALTARELELKPKELSTGTAPQREAQSYHDNSVRIHSRHNTGDLCYSVSASARLLVQIGEAILATGKVPPG
jgi:hypothetical protein